MDKREARPVIRYLQKKGNTPKEIHDDTVRILVKDFPSYVPVKKWAREFQQDTDSTEADLRQGRLKTSTTDDQVDAIQRIVFDQRRLTVQKIIL